MSVGETFAYFLAEDPNTTALPLPLQSTDRLAVVRGAGPTYYVTADAFVSAPVTGLTVYFTTVLSAGFSGYLWVNNTTAAALTVTLPPSPGNGQSVVVKDVAGNAGTDAITVQGSGGDLIEGAASLDLVHNYSWLNLVFTGVQWVQV